MADLSGVTDQQLLQDIREMFLVGIENAEPLPGCEESEAGVVQFTVKLLESVMPVEQNQPGARD